MAGTKINEATLRNTLKGTENFPVVDTDLPKGRVTAAKLKEYVQPDLTGLATKEELTSIQEEVDNLKLSTPDYCVGAWVEEDLSPESVQTYGSKEWLKKWDFYLLDTTDNAGRTTTPVGKLKKNNLLRFEDGRFAPTVGITEAQRAACDVTLYLDADHTNKYCDAGQFDAETFYDLHGMAPLYDAEGKAVRVLRPWETVETKYTIGIGRDETVYLLDNVKGKSGKVWKGLFSKPQVWDGVDVSHFPLAPTAIAPCPVCTVGGKTRAFFYLYEGETNCKSSAGQDGLCSMFLNGRTYPRVNDISQINNMNYARANNADNTLSYPYAEGGYHALNTYITAMEVLYGTKFLHSDPVFGSGISSNDVCSNETQWLQRGGVRYKPSGADSWKYATWSAQGDIYNNAEKGRSNFTTLVNMEHPKEQCMESQIIASYAAERGIAEGVEFTLYGGTYWYKNVPGTDGLDNMDVKVYKKMVTSFGAYNVDGEATNWDIEVVLRMSLIGGVNLSGDVFSYWGGGYEQVGTCMYLQSESRAGNKIDIYIQPAQEQWVRETSISKTNLGTFDFESSYDKVGVSSNLGNGYTKRRDAYSGWQDEKGGGYNTGECYYSYNDNYWGNVLSSRLRVAARFRGHAVYGYCSPRILHANYAVSSTTRAYVGSAQALIGRATPTQSE